MGEFILNAEIFAEWLKRQGYRVIRSESSYWYNAGQRVFQAFPYHWQVAPTEKELSDIAHSIGAIAFRYSTPISFDGGKVSYHVFAQPPFGLETLKSHAKNGIRKGLANCRIEQISFTRLATEGWSLQKDALGRQRRLQSMSRKQWEKCCLSAEDLPGFEAWAALVGDSLAASVITARIDDVWTIPYAQSLSKYLNLHVNNALFYSICENLLERGGIREVFTNLESLDAPGSVDDFKFRLGFRPRPVRQQIYFNPLVRPVIGAGVYSTIQSLHRVFPKSHFLSKTEGTIRFYLEGRLPAERQSVPTCLVNDSTDCQNNIKIPDQ